MEELRILRQHVEQHRYDEALLLISEMEEMSREDKINKIESFAVILLLHLIKKAAEKRTTRSWEASIKNSIWEISRTNTRRKAGGFYVEAAELRELMEDAYPIALLRASLEAFEGQNDDDELGKMVDESMIIEQAVSLVSNQQKTKK